MTDEAKEPKKKLRRYNEGTVFRKPGSRYWWIRYSQGGREYFKSSKSENRQDAVALLNSRRGAKADGRLAARAAERSTLVDLQAGVERNYKRNGLRSVVRLQQRFKHVRAFFGDKAQPKDITADRVETYVTQRQRDGAALASIRDELGVLGRAFKLAGLSRPLMPSLQVKNARTGFFTDTEIAALLPHLPRYLQPYIEALYITGWRRQELARLRWSAVDWETHTIRLERGTTKTGEPRSFPFGAHARLRAILEAQRDSASEIYRTTGRMVFTVFHRDDGREMRGWYYDAWHTACRKVGLVDDKGRCRLVHDLRRSACRNLVTRAGVSERVAMSLTGHKTRAVFDRYHIVSNADQAEAVAKLDALGARTIPLPDLTNNRTTIGQLRAKRA